jgi:predicted NBD/HSP70 family sugar kinase
MSVRKIDLSNFHVATSETARDINRRIVLSLVRLHQPISRADIARKSGLQRSTVSAITQQLIGERWVVEGALADLPRGRKPTGLHLNADRAGILGVDVRPEHTTIGLASLDARLVAHESLVTGDDAAHFVGQLSRRLVAILKAHPEIACEGIGVSLPGRVELASQKLVFAPNLGWRDLDLKRPLERATGLPVELENAANACALAEFWFGRHLESVRNLVAVTVSEGIGVGMILNGQLVRGAEGMAGEFGHVVFDPAGPVCRCGNRGCWEMFASNNAALRAYEGVKDPQAPLATTFEDLLRLDEQGHARARRALDQMAAHLAKGLAMLASGLAPEVIVIVGKVTRVWERLGPIITSGVQSQTRPRTGTRILPTDPATQPRLRGTIALVLQKHFGAPNVA